MLLVYGLCLLTKSVQDNSIFFCCLAARACRTKNDKNFLPINFIFLTWGLIVKIRTSLVNNLLRQQRIFLITETTQVKIKYTLQCGKHLVVVANGSSTNKTSLVIPFFRVSKKHNNSTHERLISIWRCMQKNNSILF